MLPSSLLLHRTYLCAPHDYIPPRAENSCAAGAIHLDLNTLAASLLARPWASMPRVPTMASPSTHACVYAAVAPPFVLPFAAGLNDQRVSPSSHPTNRRVHCASSIFPCHPRLGAGTMVALPGKGSGPNCTRNPRNDICLNFGVQSFWCHLPLITSPVKYGA